MPPNRVVALATAFITLALGALPVLANMDWTSTAGVLAGLTAVLGVAVKWIDGWQKHEAWLRVTAPLPPTEADDPDDDGPGDPDALPHFTAKDPAKIPPDQGDAGPEATP